MTAFAGFESGLSLTKVEGQTAVSYEKKILLQIRKGTIPIAFVLVSCTQSL